MFDRYSHVSASDSRGRQVGSPYRWRRKHLTKQKDSIPFESTRSNLPLNLDPGRRILHSRIPRTRISAFDLSKAWAFGRAIRFDLRQSVRSKWVINLEDEPNESGFVVSRIEHKVNDDRTRERPNGVLSRQPVLNFFQGCWPRPIGRTDRYRRPTPPRPPRRTIASGLSSLAFPRMYSRPTAYGAKWTLALNRSVKNVVLVRPHPVIEAARLTLSRVGVPVV
jgi:hypothetical protein